MQAAQLRPGKDHAVTVNEKIFCAHSAWKRIVAKSLLQLPSGVSADLRFRSGRDLLLRFGFGLRRLPPDRRGFYRRFLAIQISDATPTFDSHPMLLTHDAFYRTEAGSAQRE